MQSLVPFPAGSRRNFLQTCVSSAACALCAGLCPAPARAVVPSVAALMPKVTTRLRVVFTYPPKDVEGWPYVNYDYAARKHQILGQLSRICPEVEFLAASASSSAETAPILAADQEVDGYVVFFLGIPDGGAGRAVALSGRPALLVDDLFGGTGAFLGAFPPARKQGKPVAGITSSRIEDVAEGVRAFQAIRNLKSSRLLEVTDRDHVTLRQSCKDALGVEIKQISTGELNEAWRNADTAEAGRWAREWTSKALRVVEPSADEMQRSAAMYVGMSALLAQHHAQGIAVDCLQLFYQKKMFAYPCMGFFQMNNDGLVGACEADLQSASTMLAMQYLTGRAGYISDPVLDTAKNQIIYAHCVAPSRVFGSEGPENPYEIRSHTEDHQGAAVRSLLPIGQPLTNLKFVTDQKLVVIHSSRAVDNLEEPRACRTKLVAEVADARKLAANWQYGWHRVTVYGDHRVAVETLSHLLGLEVVNEG